VKNIASRTANLGLNYFVSPPLIGHPSTCFTFQEVEREISFRTENGLYYSYFKQLARSPSLWQGFKDLKADNLTEHGNTINILGEDLVTYLETIIYGKKLGEELHYLNSIFSFRLN